MMIDVSKAIIDFLHIQKKVSIPGIGSFRAINEQSTLGIGERVLNPPFMGLVFSDQLDDEESFVKYLQDEYNLSFAKADTAIKHYASSVLNKLLNLGTADIPGIGELVQKPGEELYFKQSEFGFNRQTYGLTPLTISPIKRTLVEKESKITQIAAAPAVVPPLATSQSSSSSWQNIWPSLLLILLLSVLLFLLALWLNGPNGLNFQESNARTEEDISNKSGTSVTEEEIINFFENGASPENHSASTLTGERDNESFPDSKTDSILPGDEETSDNSSELNPIDAAIVDDRNMNSSVADREKGLEQLADLEREENLPNNGELQLEKGEDIAGEIIDPENSEGIGKEAKDKLKAISDDENNRSDSALLSHLTNYPNLIKYKDVLSWQAMEEGCIIVVGSFSKSRNADNMRKRIVKAGLKAHTSNYGKYTRVGIVFECRDHDLEGYIDTIRRTFDQDAWYLLPEFEVIKKIQMN